MFIKNSSIVVGLALGLAACHKESSPPPQQPMEPLSQALAENGIAPQPEVQRMSDRRVNVGKSVRDACGIDDTEKAPKFDFDSANLSSADRTVLQKVSDCATNGKLRGKTLMLIGRADPRGTEDHNRELGEVRAESVRDCLVANGVDRTRIDIASAGSSGAVGVDESTWAKDRRVDIEVANTSAK